MASAKNGVRNRVRIDDVGSILKFRIGFSCGGNYAGFSKFVWIPGSILNFRIGSVSLIGGVECRDPVCPHRFRFPEKWPDSPCLSILRGLARISKKSLEDGPF